MFRFLLEDEDENIELQGSVLTRDSEMVIDINDPEGASPYLIVGRREGSYFRGANESRPGYDPVDARWASVGDRYVGLWVEDGYEYLFSFSLLSH